MNLATSLNHDRIIKSSYYSNLTSCTSTITQLKTLKKKWNKLETKFFYISIKKYGLNSLKMKQYFLKNRSIEEIEKKIIYEEIKNSDKMKKYINFYIQKIEKRNFPFEVENSLTNSINNEILPLEYYLSDNFVSS